jgi:hypothetical protein
MVSKDERKEEIKKKEDWASTLKLDKIEFNSNMTDIVSIAGVPLKKFVGKMLVKFLRGNHIPCPNGQVSKGHCIQHLINHTKNKPVRAAIAQSVRAKKRNKGTKPLVVTKDGTMYRVILTITNGTSRSNYIETMKTRSRADIDLAIIPHLHQWEDITKVYNDETNEYLSILGDSEGKYVIYANDNVPSDFDKLDAQGMYETVDYINFHYGRMRRNKNLSGKNDTDDDMINFCQSKGWLLFYHDKLSEINDKALHDCAFAELPDNVFLASSSSSSTDRLSTLSKSPSSLNHRKRQSVLAKEAADIALKKKQIEIQKMVRSYLEEHQEKLLEGYTDKMFAFEEEYEEIRNDPMKWKKKKHLFKSKRFCFNLWE